MPKRNYREYLLYSEGVSKTKHRKLTPRSSRAYANAECPERCVVGIVDTYMKRCPKDSLQNAFYLKPLQKFKGKSVWYSTVPLGHNKPNSAMKTMMSEAGVEGYYTITIEFMFAGINMFWARLRLILARAAITINITLEGIEEIKT